MFAFRFVPSNIEGRVRPNTPTLAIESNPGFEDIMMGNDCGFASTAGNAEIPRTVAWVKLRALGEGVASGRLWG